MRAVLTALLLLGACAQTPASPSLSGTHWMRTDRADDAPHFPTLDFAGDRASGHAGCNRWFAAVTANSEALRFGEIGATRMMCPPASMDTERAFFDALRATASARSDGDQLILLDAAGRELARFDNAAP